MKMIIEFSVFLISLTAIILVYLSLVRYFRINKRILVKFKKLSSDAVVPIRKRESDAGFDFYAVEDILVPAHGNAIAKSNIAWEPDTVLCYMQLKCRSGLGIKNSIEFTSAGVVDASYRGDITGKLYNMTDEDYLIKKGDRCFQGVILPLAEITCLEVSELNDTDRGTKGFGSSGK